jgi:cyclopropane-fatty-acyl-phospholipid synthase
MKNAFAFALRAAEAGWLPDPLLRRGIRNLCRQRLREADRGSCEANREAHERFIADMKAGPIAPLPEKANEQHYELPAEFFARVLGPHRKYSCCFWKAGTTSLEEAEQNALEMTARRAELADGQEVLELGCGWGSLSLWMARHFPQSRITAVSNSHSQRAYIAARAELESLTNLRVITADMNEFAPPGAARFDRVLSVEMFEHMRNYEALLQRIHSWLVPHGKLFVHIFSHRRFAYAFEPAGEDDWMARHFFSGGIMPSDDLPARFQRDLRLVEQWRWSGTHYERTANAWLENLDRRRVDLLPILAGAYGPGEAIYWFHRWRIFFLACAELFGYAQGEEWGVSHYLFERHAQPASSRFESAHFPATAQTAR